jgi:hypothetical protein
MQKISEMIGQQLRWTQPHALKMHYELRAGNVAVATLRFRSSFGSFATAASADGTWTFKRVGFWQTKATVRGAETDTDLAVFKNNTWSGGGTLELPDGRKYPANTNFWSTEYEFKRDTGEPLISYEHIGGALHISAAVKIHGLSKEIIEMPWLVSLGWYLTVLMYMDAAAAG